MNNHKESIDLAREQHAEMMRKIDEVASAIKALYLVPLLCIYLAGAGFFFYVDKLPMFIWVAMNIVLLLPFAGAAWRAFIRPPR